MNKYVLFVFLILATNVYASSGVEKKNIDNEIATVLFNNGETKIHIDYITKK